MSKFLTDLVLLLHLHHTHAYTHSHELLSSAQLFQENMFRAWFSLSVKLFYMTLEM